jgi:hypothetical protein
VAVIEKIRPRAFHPAKIYSLQSLYQHESTRIHFLEVDRLPLIGHAYNFYLEYFHAVKKFSRNYQSKSGNYETLFRLSALPLRRFIGGGSPVEVFGWAAPNPFLTAEDIDKWILPMIQNHHITKLCKIV